MKKTNIWGLVLATPVLLAAGAASAVDYTVTQPADVVADGDGVSLREAIAAANGTPFTNLAGDNNDGLIIGAATTSDRILFAVNATVDVATNDGDIDITDDVIIEGGNITSDGTSRIFDIDVDNQTVIFNNTVMSGGGDETRGGAVLIQAGSKVVMNNVTITNSEAEGGAATDGGGAIFNSGELTMVNPNLNNNTAVTGSRSGGAINNAGDLKITGGSITENTAERAGGGIENVGSVEMENVALDRNTVNVTPGNGGGFHTGGTGTLEMTGGTVNGNTAGNEGGGLWNSGAGSEMTLTNTVVSGNTVTSASATRIHEGGGIFNGGAAGNGGELNLNNVTVSNNVASGTDANGGGIFNFGGELDIDGGKIEGNTASDNGGGIASQDGTADADIEIDNTSIANNVAGSGNNVGNGGGLFIAGDADTTITNATINNNTANRDGGGIWNNTDDLALSGVTLNANNATGEVGTAIFGGGAIYNDEGTIEIDGGRITNNTASGALGTGGGIYNEEGTVTIDADNAPGNTGGQSIQRTAVIQGNTANRAGGGIENDNGTVIISETILSANRAGTNPGNGGAIHVSGAAAATSVLENTLLDSNFAEAEGGAIWNSGGSSALLVRNARIINNTANGILANQGGGGIFNGGATGNGGVATIENSKIIGNVALNSATDGSTAASGGGILNFGGTVTVTDSTIANNSAARAGGAIEAVPGDTAALNPSNTSVTRSIVRNNRAGSLPGNGGGLHITGQAVATVTRSTFHNNFANNEGGALWNSGTGNLTVTNSTLSANTATGAEGLPSRGGGAILTLGGTTTVTLTTIANNTANIGGGIANTGVSTALSLNSTLVGDNAAATDADVTGTIVSNNSLLETADATNVVGINNILGEDALLNPLTLNNGGVTPTISFRPGSPAVDGGDQNTCDNDDNDQRGVSRDNSAISQDSCTIGALAKTDIIVGTLRGNNNDRQIFVDATAQDATGFAFTLSNASGEGDATVTQIRGDLDVRGKIVDRITNIQIAVDANANGEFDAGEQVIPSTINFFNNTETFSVVFDNERTIEDGGSESYVLTVDFAANGATASYPAIAGGLALLFALPFFFTGTRRRAAAVISVFAAVTMLAGCDDSDDGDGNADSFLRFNTVEVVAEDEQDELATFPTLTQAGPVIVETQE